MRLVFHWLKTHKIIVILIGVIVYLLIKNNNQILPFAQVQSLRPNMAPQFEEMGMLGSLEKNAGSPITDYAPTVQTTDRLVVKNSSLSLLVDNVSQTENAVIQKAQELGGYMVNAYLNRPQDAPSATVTIRVPAKNLDLALNFFRGLAVKVISENLQGEDVTNQYVDIKARLDTLLKTKVKFEEIMERATAVQDILTVQRELINLQSQIDNLKGQQNYLEKNAALAKITVYLSTDELTLPYTPSESWRPAVIFKEAARSLIGFFRKIGTAVIWLAVYAVIWIPAGLIIIILYKRKKKNQLS